jgi:hypothetical protein
MEKIMNDPERKAQYYEKMKTYNSKYKEKVKENPEKLEHFKAVNRDNAKRYYYDNIEKVREKNRNYYHQRKAEVKQ